MTDPSPPPAAAGSLDAAIAAVLDKVLAPLSGTKTYLAAAGLTGLALYDASIGQYEQAAQNVLAAFSAVGLRHAIAKTS